MVELIHTDRAPSGRRRRIVSGGTSSDPSLRRPFTTPYVVCPSGQNDALLCRATHIRTPFLAALGSRKPQRPCFSPAMASPRATQRQQPAEAWRILRWRSRHWAHREHLAEGVALTMLRIPSGSFEMGAPETEAESSDRERPVHRVTLGEFLLGQTPITQAQWRAVAAWQRLEHEDGDLWPEVLDADPVAKLNKAERFLGEQRPVVNVSWHDAMAFCKRLRLRSGKNYTLPSEAQWEYACRAGTTTPFHSGATLSTKLANYDGSEVYGNGEKGGYRQQTMDVASFPANPWGL